MNMIKVYSIYVYHIMYISYKYVKYTQKYKQTHKQNLTHERLTDKPDFGIVHKARLRRQGPGPFLNKNIRFTH